MTISVGVYFIKPRILLIAPNQNKKKSKLKVLYSTHKLFTVFKQISNLKPINNDTKIICLEIKKNNKINNFLLK
jgi:hypothetical protein